jgi:hypothetical protein
MRIGLHYMGTIFRTRETGPYNHLMKFYKIGPLLEGCFMVLSPIFKIGPCLEPLLEMLLECAAFCPGPMGRPSERERGFITGVWWLGGWV